jgi:Zn-dependent peptidase ImmA (M78 family)/transcriptional regulator with XRE-family HTH domain
VPKKLNFTSLLQARKARKLSVSEVADYTKISENRLVRFETGDLEPSIPQLTKLGDLYNAPSYSFYRDAPLVLEATLPDFRKPNPSAANLSPKGLTRLWQIERRGKFVDDLAGALGKSAPKTVGLSRFTNQAVPEAAELRAGFDRWLATRDKSLRFSGTKEDAFQKHLRLFLEITSCSTSINSAPVDDYLGFYQSLSNTSHIIFINREVRHEKRRLFTLAHEMAHFVYREEGISNPFIAKNDIERRCNNYAARFLAPDRQVLQIVQSATSSTVNDIARLVNLVARETLLSRQAATLRLRELDIVSRKAASEFFTHLNMLRRVTEPSSETRKAPPKGRAVVIGKMLSEVGVYAAYTASLALKNRIVDVVDVERGLGLSESIQKDVLDLAAKRFEASAQ